ncbi:hypothetical protein JXA12_01690 [Candidatus Woesearchaeota archaeon]|nr:hypothetical protein [Candidatus Woesearchaeota archaeon]
MNKTIGSPFINCTTQPTYCDDDFDGWMTYSTNINIFANDSTVQDECNLGLDYCQYTYTVDGKADADFATECAGFGGTYKDGWCVFKNGETLDFDFQFNEDSMHDVTIECYDVVGNKETITEAEKVDDTPPVTTKVIGDPKKVDGDVEWIDSVTEISLSAVDPDPDPTGFGCDIGVDKTWYRISLDESEDACWKPADYCVVSGETPYDEERYEGCIDEVQKECATGGEREFDDWYDCVEQMSYRRCEVSSEWKLYRPGQVISDISESCHVMEYFSVDLLGNVEDVETNCFFVDKTAPELKKDNGDAILDRGESAFMTDDNLEGAFHWITSSMPITFTCDDTWNGEADHPSEDELLCYKVGYDMPSWETDITADYCDGDLTDDGFCCVAVDEEKEFEFSFNADEESKHSLSYYCVDAVEKKTDVHTQYYKVDDTAPSITKTMIGEDHLGTCPPSPEPSSDECYVADNGENGVSIAVADGGAVCAVDNTLCTYELWWNASLEECQDVLGPEHLYDFSKGWCFVEGGEFGESGQDVIFNEDSTHVLIVNCADDLGNEMLEDVQEFLVDSTPPVTTKTYDEYVEFPYPKGCVDDMPLSLEYMSVRNGNGFEPCVLAKYITSATNISLSASDEKVGTDFTEYRVSRPLGESLCANCDGWMDALRPDMGDWSTYAEPFSIPEDSCHVIEYRSTDLLGNVEDIKWQCVFVDNQPPMVDKLIGAPNVTKDDDLYITMDTPITMVCDDRVDDHPVDHVELFWHYRSAETCGELVGMEEGWTDLESVTAEDLELADPYRLEKTIYFPEDSCHELEYWCVDALGNTAGPFTEIDIVDSVAPVITTGIEGPSVDNGTHVFIDGVTNITVDAYDPDPHPVEGVLCNFTYDVIGGPKEGLPEEEQELAPPFKVNFPEESEHVLSIECWDALGNTATKDEVYLVDKTAPGIWKEYSWLFSDVYKDEVGDYYAKFTSADAPIYAGVWDEGPHQSGIAEVKYKVSLAADDACKYYLEVPNGDIHVETAMQQLPQFAYEFGCDEASAGDWVTVDPEDYDEFNFTVGEESCHLIEVMATDNVDKCKLHRQYVYVDATAPETAKVIGIPKSPMSEGNIELGQVYFENLTTAFCAEGEENCMEVTLLTSIDLACNDPEPHPSNGEAIYFQVSLDGDDVTPEYCSGVSGGEYIDDVESEHYGFCYVASGVSSFYFTEETWHKLTYYCEDHVGNVGVPDVEYFKVEGTSFKIDLNKKWNLISVPVRLQDDSMDAVFLDQPGIVSVWSFDGHDWHVYTPGGVNDLDTLVPGDGYWVLTTEPSTLTIGGSLLSPTVTPPGKDIVKGWNLIGYYGVEGAPTDDDDVPYYGGPNLWGEGRPVLCALDTLNPAWGTNVAPSLWTYWEPDNPAVWKQLDDQVHWMNPGAGYWLLYNQGGEVGEVSGIYAPATGCGFLDYKPVFAS